MTEIEVRTKDTTNYTSELVVGLMAGSVVGTALALWNAPCAGDELVDRVKGWFQRKADNVSHVVQGESVDDSLLEGRAIAHMHRAEQADRLLSNK